MNGIWIPLVTPFRDGRLDTAAVENLVAPLCAAGIHGLVVCGTTGEAMALGTEERRDLVLAVDQAVRATGKPCPLMLGLGGGNTAEMVRDMQSCNALPIAGYLISPPHYVRPSQAGIVAHYRELATVSAHPVVLYNIPSRSGVSLDLKTIQEIARHPRVVAIKDCSGDPDLLIDLINTTRLAVLNGNDSHIFNTLALGGHGAICASAHVRPDLFVALYDAMMNGQLKRGRALFLRLLPLMRVLFSEPNPAPVKAALALQGRIRDELRLPMTPASAACHRALVGILDDLDVLPRVHLKARMEGQAVH